MGLQRRLLLVLALGLFAASLAAQEADLVVTKSGPAEAAAGSDVTYSVDVLNLGADDASSVQLIDFIPAGMTYVAHTADPSFTCTPNAGDVTCTTATMSAGATASFTFTFNIPLATAPATTFTNVATVSSQTFDPNDENNTSSTATSTPGPPQPDMFVMKEGPGAAAPDSDVTYTITLGNASTDAASNVQLTDTLPGTMTFVSLNQDSGPAFSCTTGGTITCDLASFPANGSATFTLVGHIPSGTPSGTDFTNTAQVTADNDPNDINNSSTTTAIVSAVDVAVDKTGPANVNAGSDIAYTITLTNNGPDTAQNAAFTDTLPPNTTFVSLTQVNGTPAVCSPLAPGDTGTTGCSIALFGSGQSAQFTLTVEVGNTASVTNTANASTSSFDTNTANDTDSVTTTVTPIADLAVVKSGPASVVATTDVTYTVTVTNNGPSDASNVTLTDNVPAGTTFVSANQTSGPTFSCSGTTTISCSIATLASGATATFEFVMNVDVANAGPIANTANVSSSTADPDSSNNSSTTNTTVTPAPVDLSITKIADHDRVLVGTNITYTITVTNGGPGTATNTTVTDTIPANTTYVSATPSQGTCSGTTTVTCSLGTLTAGANATITLVVTAPSTPQPVVNTATVSSNETESDPPDNTTTSTVNAAVLPTDVPTLSPFAMALLALGLGIALVLKAR